MFNGNYILMVYASCMIIIVLGYAICVYKIIKTKQNKKKPLKNDEINKNNKIDEITNYKKEIEFLEKELNHPNVSNARKSSYRKEILQLEMKIKKLEKK